MTNRTPWHRRAAVSCLICGSCLLIAALVISRPLLPGLLLVAGGVCLLLASSLDHHARHH